MRQNPDVERGPNDFTLGVNGPDPKLEVGGSQDEQERQRDFLLALNSRAALSYGSRSTVMRVPSDEQVGQLLGNLDRNPPIGTDGREVTRAVYQSTIPNATAQEAFEHFINNPNEVFNAGGMEIRPPTDRLKDGGRYMLEVGGPPPSWLPIEITVDAANNAFTINTLDGHVLRGEQTFTFTDNCEGGATLTQDARFQASTKLVGDLQNLVSISDEQHESWQFAHREIYEQFNGDRDYEGMGIGFDLGKLLKFGLTLLSDPGNTVDTLYDVAGELANETLDTTGYLLDEGIDLVGASLENGIDTVGSTLADGIDGAGSGVNWVMDEFGIPGRDTVEDVFNTAGDVVEGGFNAVGDVVEGGYNIVGDVVETGLDIAGDFVSAYTDSNGDVVESLIDSINPFD